MAIAIERADDPRVSEFSGLRSRRRESDEFFIVESPTAVQRLIESPYPVRAVLVSVDRHARMAAILATVSAPVYVLSDEVMAEVIGFESHRGALASATRVAGPQLADVLAHSTRLVVLEGCNDHENLGVLARSVRGLGFDALVLDPQCADPFYRRSVRVSMGEILRLTIAHCPPLATTIPLLHASAFETWALTPRVDADSLFEMAIPQRLALLVGAEGRGLTAPALRAAGREVRIPMHHGVDSLNIGHAAAIAMAATSPPVREFPAG